MNDYLYTSRSECIDVEGIDDVVEFKATKQSLEELDFSAQETKDIFKIVAAVLHLGQLKFNKHEEKNTVKSSIANPESKCH